MHSKDPADYIIEAYTDKSHLNPHTLNYTYYRVREWLPEKKRYEVSDGFGTAVIIRVILVKHGVSLKDVDKIPLVDLTDTEERIK